MKPGRNKRKPGSELNTARDPVTEEVADQRRPKRKRVSEPKEQQEGSSDHVLEKGSGRKKRKATGKQRQKQHETVEEVTQIGKTPSSGFCRLCHGKFSSRSLRHAFGKVPVTYQNAEHQRRVDQLFFTHFQQLVGVSVQRDPELPQFVCTSCHAQFYKCRSILRTFILRVNTSPTDPRHGEGRKMQAADDTTESSSDLIVSSPESLHSLMSWTHNHAGICSTVPNLQQVLSKQYFGIVKAVWGCGGGHDYVMEMDPDSSTSSNQTTKDKSMPHNPSAPPGINAEEAKAPTRSRIQGKISSTPSLSDTEDRVQSKSPALPMDAEASMYSTSHIAYVDCREPLLSGAAVNGQDCRSHCLDSNEMTKDESTDLSDRDFPSNEEEDSRDHPFSEDLNELYQEKAEEKPAQKKRGPRRSRKPKEPGERKKPGPKPGWKKKLTGDRGELPTIYKCHYPGCTAVYRGADGMKKHIKNLHEEMKEQPCPHPGCNKLFTIGRYLQRHFKLIHSNQRNYICDQCGQAFKQRKHLSVHQLRHSGAKPLQCEICGFQCRQRASLKYHMTKHKAEAELEFACDQCGKRFEKTHNLNVHMSMVHPLTLNPPKTEAESDIQSGTVDGQTTSTVDERAIGIINGQVNSSVDEHTSGSLEGQTIETTDEKTSTVTEQVIGTMDGQDPGTVTALALGTVDGQVIGIVDRQISGSRDGEAIGIINGHAIAMVDVHSIGIVQEHMPGTVEEQAINPVEEHIVGAVEEQAINPVIGQLPDTVEEQIQGTMEEQGIVPENGQLPGTVEEQAISTVNGQLSTTIETQAISPVIGQMPVEEQITQPELMHTNA
ncbi:zinc finger protein 276 [Bombina bombina]|uniref:zinc finger protein 276 n=1 Tax=Bombina bombina TaxID=8345 RepID=UPI00235A7BEB|nr:zinc finger protein 276 [Bombina bombina]